MYCIYSFTLNILLVLLKMDLTTDTFQKFDKTRRKHLSCSLLLVKVGG